MNERKPAVVMTVTGRAKEHPAGADIREILETICTEYRAAGSNWDRPDRLFIGGKCIVEGGLADIAWEYGKFQRAKEDEVDVALKEYIDQRFMKKLGAEA